MSDRGSGVLRASVEGGQTGRESKRGKSEKCRGKHDDLLRVSCKILSRSKGGDGAEEILGPSCRTKKINKSGVKKKKKEKSCGVVRSGKGGKKGKGRPNQQKKGPCHPKSRLGGADERKKFETGSPSGYGNQKEGKGGARALKTREGRRRKAQRDHPETSGVSRAKNRSSVKILKRGRIVHR